MTVTLNANALCTVADLQADVSGISADNAARSINAASQLIEDYCRRKFQRATVIEKVAGYGRNRLSVKRCPLESVTSVTDLGGSTVDSSAYEVEGGIGSEEAAAGFIFNRAGWKWTAAIMDANQPFLLPGTEARDYTVTYVGGYVLPNDATPSPAVVAGTLNLPSSLSEFCLSLAARLYRWKGTDTSTQAKTVGNASVQFGGWRAGRLLLNEADQTALDPYKVA